MAPWCLSHRTLGLALTAITLFFKRPDTVLALAPHVSLIAPHI